MYGCRGWLCRRWRKDGDGDGDGDGEKDGQGRHGHQTVQSQLPRKVQNRGSAASGLLLVLVFGVSISISISISIGSGSGVSEQVGGNGGNKVVRYDRRHAEGGESIVITTTLFALYFSLDMGGWHVAGAVV
jgi:hypothetical protein